ncbi:MAG: peptidase dimerization domain-containing protein, partial [Candidatus Lokiarchaeia archaeon]|nr:peptidase dimerization domain-containing protein [Candidatus Lokiarchaeia archaeon]
MLKLEDLGKPTDFWNYFNNISSIPRKSRFEDKIRIFIKNEAEKYGFIVKIDEIGNIAVKIPAVNQKLNCILQCHMDMVCEKNEGVIHDFLKDPLKLKIIEIDDEKWVTAEGTTLGADNGTGICFLLTLMKKIHEDKVKFNTLGLDLLFTVREEYDMGGAKNIDPNLVAGNYLINLDSGDKSITIGCTGGIGFQTKIKKKSNFIDKDQLKLQPIDISVLGLIGGHSGRCNEGQAHAIRILSQILWKLNKKYEIHINSINGGGAANAIPREAKSIFFAKQEQIESIKSDVFYFFSEIKKQYNGLEEKMALDFKKIENFTNNEIISKNVQVK